ncbi:MAG: OmpH family outer membrane protein [Bacteroidales bacterium]|nr:OmpH family outer membrane protein [Bacteroidales bacterium]
MKKTPIILSICALAVAVAALVLTIVPICKADKAEAAAEEAEASAINVAYFIVDEVVSNYQMAIDLNASFEKKAKGINDDLTRRNNKLENEQKEIADKLNKGLVTRSTAEVQIGKWQEKVAQFQELTQQKQNELAEEQQVMLNNVANAIGEYVKKYNEEKGYTMIFSTTSGLLSQPVADAEAGLNITADLIEGLNKEYQANKKK